MKLEEIFWGEIHYIGILCFILAGFFLGYAKADGLIPDLLPSRPSFSATSGDNCSNMDVMQTSQCLHSYLMTFFHYNISNKNKQLSLEELKNAGGVCWQYSEWYVDNAIKNGLLGQTIDFYGDDKKNGHEIAVLYNHNLTQYCILDQNIMLGCINLGSEDKNESK